MASARESRHTVAPSDIPVSGVGLVFRTSHDHAVAEIGLRSRLSSVNSEGVLIFTKWFDRWTKSSYFFTFKVYHKIECTQTRYFFEVTSRNSCVAWRALASVGPTVAVPPLRSTARSPGPKHTAVKGHTDAATE